jgi:hypothetical protein
VEKRFVCVALLVASFGAQAMLCLPKQAGGDGTAAVKIGNSEGDAFVWKCKVGDRMVPTAVADFANSPSPKVRLNRPAMELSRLLQIKDNETNYHDWTGSKLITLIKMQSEK